MTIWEAMKKRHSVRQYTDKPIDKEALTAFWRITENSAV